MSRMRAALSTRLFDFGFRKFPQFQAERHVLGDRHMRVKRIVLEHHGDVAIFRRQVIDDFAADRDFALRDFLKSGNHPQCRAFSAARGADQHDKLMIGNIEIDIADRDDIVVALAHVPQCNFRHPRYPALARRRVC